MGRALELTDTQIDDQLELNLLGPWRVARAAGSAMRARGEGGSIVLALSRASVEVSSGAAAYQVSKAAAARLVEVMARELRADGIRVNAVMPSVIDTPSNRQSMGESGAEKWVPAGHIAAVITWLCSPDAGDISGALVPVYGRA
jgi:NAD(P)-dependent dehydrogenase (short-subunit alcohol dehydrogenase family)